MKFENLHKEIRIGSLALNNRLVMPPMATEKTDNGEVTQGLIDYYNEKTRGGYLGLVIQEHSYISIEGKASPNQVSIATDDTVADLRKITDVIHANGSKVFAQLAHAGSAAKMEITGCEPVSASGVVNPCDVAKRMGATKIPHELTKEEIKVIVNKFADAAMRAKKAGYDGIEIHSAHGYLLNQFYSPLTNKRTDEYTGTTLEGRTRIHAEIIAEVRNRVGNDFPVSLRWGASDYMEGGSDKSEIVEAARIFEKAGVDMLSISGGMCDYRRPDSTEPGWFSELSEEVKKAVNIPVLLVGGITDGETAEKLLSEEKADMIGIARALLRDSDLPGKIMEQ